MRRVPPLVIASFFSAVGAVHADEGYEVGLRTFRSPLSHQAPLTLEPAAAQEGLVNASVRLNYAFQPVVLRELVPGSDGLEAGPVSYAVVEHQVTADLGFGLGITSWLTVGVELPFVMAQTGDDTRDDPQAVARIGDESLPVTALSDPALSVKLTYYETPARSFGIASRHRVSFPLGDDHSLDAEGSFTMDNAVLADVATGIPVRFHFNADHFFRFEEGRFGCMDDPDCETRFRHTIGIGAAAVLELPPLSRMGLFPFVESRTVLPVAPVAAGDLGPYVFSSAGARLEVGDVALLGGAEWSYVGEVGAPPIRFTLGLSYAPGAHDRDRDGVRDDRDRCPDLKGQEEGGLGHDGCPAVPEIDCQTPCDPAAPPSPPPPSPLARPSVPPNPSNPLAPPQLPAPPPPAAQPPAPPSPAAQPPAAQPPATQPQPPSAASPPAPAPAPPAPAAPPRP